MVLTLKQYEKRPHIERKDIKPKSVIRPQYVHYHYGMVLFPNIFYFLIGILSVFVT